MRERIRFRDVDLAERALAVMRSVQGVAHTLMPVYPIVEGQALGTVVVGSLILVVDRAKFLGGIYPLGQQDVGRLSLVDSDH